MTKQALVAGLFCVSSAFVMAQPAKVLNAYNYMNDNELIKAKAEIEPATTNEKTMADAKTWYYRGQIYENIYKNSFVKNDKTGAALYPELAEHKKGAVKTSIESYEKAIALGSKKINMNEVKQHHAEMSKWAYQEGVEHYNEKEFGQAGEMFAKCYDIKKQYGQVDTLAAYNAGLSYKFGKDATNAEKYLGECINLNFKTEQAFLDLLHMYSESGNKDAYMAKLKEARAKLPNNQQIIQEEINIYIDSKEYDKALENLNLAVQNEPSNKALLYARGIILDNKQAEQRKNGDAAAANETYAKAEADYKKVIELDPENFDGNYSLGALYYNRGAEMLNEANNILDDKKYKAAKTEAEAQLQISLPYLEKAHNLNPTDRQTMESLKVIYARTNQMDKFNAIKEKLEN
ncbi:MAG: tetratricopeptide repeat protein [Flavobacteriales bacterium]